MNAPKPISTSGRRDRQNAISLGSILLPPLVVHENGAAGEDELADFQAFADLGAAVLLDADLDVAAAEQHGLLLDPHRGEIALPDHRVDRNRGARLVLADRDLEARKHLGLE